MTTTEELRRLLDERGVEWWPAKYYKDENTVWRANGMEWRASEQTDGKLLIGCTSLAHLTPEQAVEATLGRGTCQADETDTWECVCDAIGHYGERMTVHVMECSECGRTYEHVNGPYEYCPHCRARITEVTDG